MYDAIKTGAQFTAYIAEGIAVLFIASGIIGAVWLYLKGIISKAGHEGMIKSRWHMGHSLLLGLDFLIGADILKTAVAPAWEDIGKLAAIVGIRTVLNFFLAKEIKESEREASLISGK